MVAEALRKGLKAPFYDPTLLPNGVLDRAKELVRTDVGEEEFESEINTDTYEETMETFHGDFNQLTITSDEWPGISMHNDVVFIRPRIELELQEILRRYKRIKCGFTYKCLMVKTHTNVIRATTNDTEHHEEVEESRVALIKSGSLQQLALSADIKDIVDNAFLILDAEIEKYTENGSGYKWVKSLGLIISFTRFIAGMGRWNRTESIEFQGLCPNSGGKWIRLPKWLRTREVFNPRRSKSDEKCFVWAILRALYPPPEGFEPSQARRCIDIECRFDEIKLPDTIEFPVECSKRLMKKVEEMNDFSLSVFLIGEKEYAVRPIYVSQNRKPKHVKLGLIEKSDGTTSHYVTIKDLSKIVAPFKQKKRFFCENCFSPHQSEPALKKHEEECFANEPTRIKLPRYGGKDHFLSWKEWRYKLPAPFVVYADTEALLRETRDSDKDNVFARHKPVAWAYYIQCHYPQHRELKGANGLPLGEVRSYCGPNAMHEFLDSLAHDAEVCSNVIKSTENNKYRGEIPLEYVESNTCHICGEEGFERVNPKRYKVLDHDHITGLYRGAAHAYCNMQYYYSKNWRLPVFFHNLKNYDGYHIIKGLEGYIGGIEKMNCIARSLDKFTSFTIDDIRFTDSMQFLLGSLDRNVEGLKKGLTLEQMKEAFEPVVTHFGLQNDDEKFKLLMGKGIYPYEYMKKMDVMKETKLPPKEAFFSNLHNANITDEDYERAKKCFQAFGCETLEDYTMLYVKLDVLQLASCFEKLRRTALEPGSLELDPAHFITAPSMAWSGMLYHACHKQQLRIENMTELEMMFMTQKGIRGGITMVFNPRLETDEKSQGKYWDANNLYGWAMSQMLPLGVYRWEKLLPEAQPYEDADGQEYLLSLDNTHHDLEKASNYLALMQEYELWHREDMDSIAEGIMNLDPTGERGYVLEVDVEYPASLHNEHNDMPFFPEKKFCTPSPYTMEQMHRVYAHYGDGRIPPAAKKLVLDLTPKTKYVVHYRMLQEALRHGLKLTKVHRVFSFKQSYWLKTYIDYCTRMRALAVDDAARDFWKLLANSIYGKTVEDVRRRRQVDIIHGDAAREKGLRIASSPWVKDFRVIIKNQLVLVEKFKTVCTLNRPTIIGFTVLELSKLHMYNWHYNHIKPTFGEDAQLCYMDTDSTIYKLTGEDIDTRLYNLQMNTNIFDLSKLAKAMPNHILLQDLGRGKPQLNAAVLGNFKDEMDGEEISDAVFLRPKSYSIRLKRGKTHGRMKGIPNKAIMPSYGPPTVDGNIPPGRRITHEDYIDVWNQTLLPKVEFQKIDRTPKLDLVTKKVTKMPITSTDDKSYYFNASQCVRYGHYCIAEQDT